MSEKPQPHETLEAALAAAQAEFPEIHKGRTAKVKTTKGYSYEYRYADISDVLKAVRPVTGRHGLAITQPIVTADEGGLLLLTEIRHSSGSCIQSQMKLPHANDPQAFGSLLTYLRRYALCAILGIAAEEDDDAQSAQDMPAQKAPRKPSQPRQATRDERPIDDDLDEDRPATAEKSASVWSWYDEAGLEVREKSAADVARGLTRCAKSMREEMGEGYQDNADWHEWIRSNAGPIGHIVANAPERTASFWRKAADGIVHFEDEDNSDG